MHLSDTNAFKYKFYAGVERRQVNRNYTLEGKTRLTKQTTVGFAPIFPDTCYHLTHYWLAAVDIPVASDNPVHYADAIRYNGVRLENGKYPTLRLFFGKR